MNVATCSRGQSNQSDSVVENASNDDGNRQFRIVNNHTNQNTLTVSKNNQQAKLKGKRKGKKSTKYDNKDSGAAGPDIGKKEKLKSFNKQLVENKPQNNYKLRNNHHKLHNNNSQIQNNSHQLQDNQKLLNKNCQLDNNNCGSQNDNQAHAIKHMIPNNNELTSKNRPLQASNHQLQNNNNKISNNNQILPKYNSNQLQNNKAHAGNNQIPSNSNELPNENHQLQVNKQALENNASNNEESRDIQLKNELNAKRKHTQYQRIMEFRCKLPAFNKMQEIIDVINKNQIVIIGGGTGCGKTTQVSQFILDDAIEKGRGSSVKIMCTQPRRIAAISVAERVAEERMENLGQSVGYQIRLEKKLCQYNGSILFCTPGILLQLLKHNPTCSSYTHIILDEIHERTTMGDFLLALIKQIIPQRPDLKIILMSATMNSQRFSQYFNDCPIINIPGMIYPVTEYYLEDIIKLTKFKSEEKARNSRSVEELEYFEKTLQPALKTMMAENTYSLDVISELRKPSIEELNLDLIHLLLTHICETKGPGAILIFLPGYQNISALRQKLIDSGQFPITKFQITPLHSLMPTSEQKLIFNTPPAGVRKIIISTSIAEASITIEDVVYVIDCGKVKLTRYDLDDNIEVLMPEWQALSNAQQRRGRAGRVQAGECYHLYTRARESTFDEFPTPEMKRELLLEVILQIKLLNVGPVRMFLHGVLDPPNDKAIELSVQSLQELDALDDVEKLTPLGHHLAQLPVHPRIGKMLILGSIFSCIEPVFTIAASLAFKEPFYVPIDQEEDAHRAKVELSFCQYSDHIALVQALRGYCTTTFTGESRLFCNSHFLSSGTLNLLVEMRRQFTRSLCDMKFLQSNNPHDHRANLHSRNFALVKGIICAGLFPNIVRVRFHQNEPYFQTIMHRKIVKIHPKSVNSTYLSSYAKLTIPTHYIAYYHKQQSSAIFLHDTTFVTDAAVKFAASNHLLNTPDVSLKKQWLNSFRRLFSQNNGSCNWLLINMNKILRRQFCYPGPIQWNSRDGYALRNVIKYLTDEDELYYDICRYIRH